jgi:hypothetical protein
MATATKQKRKSPAGSKVQKVRDAFQAATDPMALKLADIEKTIGGPCHASLYYKIKAEFRKGPAKHTGRKHKATINGVEVKAGYGEEKRVRISGGKKAHLAMLDRQFMEYMMWVNVGLRRGWFDLYVNADTSDIAKLRAAFDANHA